MHWGPVVGPHDVDEADRAAEQDEEEEAEEGGEELHVVREDCDDVLRLCSIISAVSTHHSPKTVFSRKKFSFKNLNFVVWIRRIKIR